MTPDFEYPVAIRAQPAFEPAAPYGQRQLDVLGGQAYTSAEAQIRSWPGYQPTPLRDLSGLARAVGVAGIRWMRAAASDWAASRHWAAPTRSAGSCCASWRPGWAGTTCPWRICCPAAIAN